VNDNGGRRVWMPFLRLALNQLKLIDDGDIFGTPEGRHLGSFKSIVYRKDGIACWVSSY
jgi:hypothetical protein